MLMFAPPLSLSLPVAPPEVEPIVTGCSVDQECPDYNSCINDRCADPCVILDPCAANAFCKVLNHQPKCSCPEGYIGDPKIECRPRKSSRTALLCCHLCGFDWKFVVPACFGTTSRVASQWYICVTNIQILVFFKALEWKLLEHN
jgi:hypothetical protein